MRLLFCAREVLIITVTHFLVALQLRERREVRTDIKLMIQDKTRTTPANPKAAVNAWRSNG
jgi:hypothetical protein